MLNEMLRTEGAPSVVDSKGNTVPGLFAFDSLEPNKDIEKQIAEFIIDEDHKAKLQELLSEALK